jgi:hypothetical protein
MEQTTIERAWVATLRADLLRQLADLKLDHDNAEQAVNAMNRQLDRLSGAIEGIDQILRHADVPMVVTNGAGDGWPIGG